MSRCGERSTDVLLYLDNALSGQELENFRAHLVDCSDCRELLDQELALSSLLHDARPLYVAPQALRARVAVAVEQVSAVTPSSDRSGRTRMQKLTSWPEGFFRAALNWKLLGAMTLVLVLTLVFIPGAAQRVRAKDYVQAAAARLLPRFTEVTGTAHCPSNTGPARPR
jgi:hypothetical protein